MNPIKAEDEFHLRGQGHLPGCDVEVISRSDLYDCAAQIDTPEMCEIDPSGFILSCCEAYGGESGCKERGPHQPESSKKIKA